MSNEWVLIKLPTHTRLLRITYGGYLSGDSWNLNSGVVKVEKDGDLFTYHGRSGSVYTCHKNNYGLRNSLGFTIVDRIKKGQPEAVVLSSPEDYKEEEDE